MQKLVVTPIGTCRINTPLRRAESRFPISLNLEKIYGFTHTSDEALQQVRYLQGEKVFAEGVKPIVFRTEADRSTDTEIWKPSDLHIVEISSAKKVRSGGDSVQLNYIYRYFADFFSSSTRTQKFWSLTKRQARAELGEFLRGETTYRMMSPEDQALLASLRIEDQDFASIKADMSEIVERLGRDTLLFMTHVNATTADGSTIPAREWVIDWVKMAAHQLDVPCFDPTGAMLEFGQERAMENGGLDLTHFTDAFSDRAYAELHRTHVGRLVDARPELLSGQDSAVRQQLLADNIDALMRFDDFLVGTRRLYAALRQEPDSRPLIQLRGQALAKIGDFERAVSDLVEIEQSSGLPPEGRIALLEAYAGTKAWPQAIQLAEDLLGDEYESAVIHACAAMAYEHTGLLEEAVTHWKQAFRRDRSDLTAALKGLSLLSQMDRTQHFEAWREEILEHGSGSASGAFEIGTWALEHRDQQLLSKAFSLIAARNFGLAENLFGSMLDERMYQAAAECLRLVAQWPNPPREIVRNRGRLARPIGSLATKLTEEGQLAFAFQLAHAADIICADRQTASIVRQASTYFRNKIRDAYRSQDYAAVLRTAAEAGDPLYEDLGTAIVVAQSLHKLDRGNEAIDLLVRLQQQAPEHVGLLRWSGRIAAGLGRFEVALPMYAALGQLSDPDAAQFRGEIDRFFATAEKRALRQLRQVTLEGRHELALEIADKLRPYIDDVDRLERDRARLKRMLRVRLRQIELGEWDEDDREDVLNLLLRIDPDDAVILRRAAVDRMRRMRFQEAAELWTSVERLNPGRDNNLRHLERCRILAARQQKSSMSRIIAVAS